MPDDTETEDFDDFSTGFGGLTGLAIEFLILRVERILLKWNEA